MDEINPDKIEACLNFGMSTAKQQHCIIQPQILPNLLDHSQKRDVDSNHAPVVIGALLGRVDGKIIDISNCFPMTLKTVLEKKQDKENDQESTGNNQGNKKEIEYVFDTEYVKKMIKFNKQLNDQEAILGVYISSTDLNKIFMVIVSYFRELFLSQKVRSPLQSPIIMLFDPLLKNNKLDIKILNIQSFYLEECPLFSELPFEFNLENFGQTGLDVLFYGQEHFDTMAILDDKRDISQDKLNDLIKKQQILSNKELMMKNFQNLISQLEECESYIQDVIEGKQIQNPKIGRQINKCLSQFSSEDMALLEQMVLNNFKNAMMTNNLAKLQMAQIGLTEKINNLFIQSLNQYILNQNQKFQSKQDFLSQQEPSVGTQVKKSKK